MSGTAGGKFIISYYFILLLGFHSKEFVREVISGIYFLGKHCVTFFVGHAHLNKKGHSFIYFYLLVRSVWNREEAGRRSILFVYTIVCPVYLYEYKYIKSKSDEYQLTTVQSSHSGIIERGSAWSMVLSTTN